MIPEPRQQSDYTNRQVEAARRVLIDLGHAPGGMTPLSASWHARRDEKDVTRAMEILREKFEDPASFAPLQVVDFYHSPNQEERDMQARRAYELVKEFLGQIDDA